MNDVLFGVIEIIVIAIALVVVRYLIPYVQAKTRSIVNGDVYAIVEAAVMAAEQTVKASGQGKAKKAQVMSFVVNWLNAHNISITMEQLDKLVEAAVYAMNKEM